MTPNDSLPINFTLHLYETNSGKRHNNSLQYLAYKGAWLFDVKATRDAVAIAKVISESPPAAFSQDRGLIREWVKSPDGVTWVRNCRALIWKWRNYRMCLNQKRIALAHNLARR